jgi:ligand-binding sensor domain-containing protein/two-component sensor histidine kinase
MYKRLLLVAGLYWLTLAVQAQGTGYRYVNFGLKDGLYDSYFYTAAQDNLGFIWVGAGGGLYKYDGSRFKKVNSLLDKPGNAIGNFLLMVNKDTQGNLWLGSTNSLQWLNPATNRFWQPPHNAGNTVMMKSQIHFSFFGTDTWLATYKNFFYRFNAADSSFTSFASKYPAGANPLVYRVFEHAGRVYAVHPNGVYCFSVKGDFIRFAPFSNSEISNGILLPEENSLLLSSHINGLFRFNLNTFAYTPVLQQDATLKNNILLSLYQRKNGQLLLGGYGLYRADMDNKKVWADSPGEAKTDYDFKINKVGFFLEDRENNIWVCSHFGLAMIPWQNNQIPTMPVIDPASGNSTEIVKIYKNPLADEHFITTAAADGLLVYKNGAVTSIRNARAPGNSIKFLFYRQDGKVFATDYLYFYDFDYQNKKLSPVTLNDQAGKPVFQPKHCAEGIPGTLYMGSRENGFYKWDYKNGPLVHYDLADIDKDAADNHILPMYADSRNHIWFISNNGVYVYAPGSNSYQHLVQSNGNSRHFMGKTLAVTEDANHHIWILTEGNGLFECIKNGDYTIHHESSTTNKTIRGDGIWDMEKDVKENILWLSTVEGLARFNPVTKQLYGSFSMQNGMKDNGGGYHFEQSGNQLFQIFFSNINIIDRETYRWNRQAPKPIITSFKVQQQERITRLDTSGFSLSLKPGENYFEIEFAGLSLNNSNMNRYFYRLEGIDKEWQYNGDKNMVSYSALSPGRYTFSVKYLNNDGVESPPQQVFITIKKPFYKTAGFIGALALLLAGAAYAWYRYRINNLRQKEQLKQLVAETEMKALRAQMNPHFIFNSLNSIQKYILKNEHFEASQYLTKFSRLIRLILDHSNQHTILLSSELDLLRLYVEMESLRFENRFEYSISADEHLNADTVQVPSMLIQPYVENAIWHGLLHLPATQDGKEAMGRLTISVTGDGSNSIKVVIEDNGVGREKAAELKSKQVLKKKSYGMQITEDRIAVINRTLNMKARAEIVDLKDGRGHATGTRVELHIPLQTIHL